MDIVKIGYSWPEPKGFRVARERGIAEYHFLHFWDSFEIIINGEKIKTEPHACIIYKPRTPQFYNCASESTQDWFRIVGNLDDTMEKYGLSYNTVYYPENYEFITSLTRKMEFEFTSRDMFYEDICRLYLEQFFVFLSRGVSAKDDKSNLNSETRDQLIRLRRQIQLEYNKKWTIEDMANLINLSPSYLHVSYKRFFGSSPMNDLISVRIERARTMLSDTKKSVNEIAARLGYNNPSHFIRQFTKNEGVSPYKYRQRTRIENIHRDRFRENP